MSQVLKSYLSTHYPEETLKAMFLGDEKLNPFLGFLLMGIIGHIGATNYYLGLTNKRIILNALNMWTNRPTDQFSEILLGRVSKVDFQEGRLTSKVIIHYGENIERKFNVGWKYKQDAKDFIEEFGSLPSPELTESENSTATGLEEMYLKERNRALTNNVIAGVIIVGILAFLVLLLMNS